MLLAGRTALVTGGTRGIGAAIAERFVREGATVTVTGRTAESKPPKGSTLRAVDFADARATEAFASSLDFDILVNNAGINVIAPFAEIQPSDFDAIHAINVRAPFLLCRGVLAGMRKRGGGRIVNIGSIFAVVSKEKRGSYSTSKFALDGMTAALAAEVAADGILANCVSPGFIETDLTRKILSEAERAELAARIPIRRFGKPEEIASLVAWLASSENSYVSGQNFIIDGGFSRV